MSSKTQNNAIATTNKIKADRKLREAQIQASMIERDKNLASLGDLSGSEDNLIEFEGEEYELIRGRNPWKPLSWLNNPKLSHPDSRYQIRGIIEDMGETQLVKLKVVEAMPNVAMPVSIGTIARPVLDKEGKLNTSMYTAMVNPVTTISYTDLPNRDGKRKLAFVNQPGVNLCSNMAKRDNEKIQSKQTLLENRVSQNVAEYRTLLEITPEQIAEMDSDTRIEYNCKMRTLPQAINADQAVLTMVFGA